MARFQLEMFRSWLWTENPGDMACHVMVFLSKKSSIGNRTKSRVAIFGMKIKKSRTSGTTLGARHMNWNVVSNGTRVPVDIACIPLMTITWKLDLGMAPPRERRRGFSVHWQVALQLPRSH